MDQDSRHKGTYFISVDDSFFFINKRKLDSFSLVFNTVRKKKKKTIEAFSLNHSFYLYCFKCFVLLLLLKKKMLAHYWLLLVKLFLIFHSNTNVLFLFTLLSSGAELEFRSPRAHELWDKWRYVWMMAWERQRRLHDHLVTLHDLERLRNFSWDEWRKRVSLIEKLFF